MLKKKPKYLNFLNPLNKLTREPSLKILKTEKEVNKKRNISIDFSSTPIRPKKKVKKRNLRKNSYNNIIFNQTEETKTGTNNLSYMPSHNLILKKNPLIQKNKNNIFLKKSIVNINNSFNFNLQRNYKMINLNLAKATKIKKNSKNYKINTRPFLTKNKNNQNNINNFKTFASVKNKMNNYSNSILTDKKVKANQIIKLNSKELKLAQKTKAVINNKKKLNQNTKTKKNNNKNLSINSKIYEDEIGLFNILKNSKNNHHLIKGISPPIRNRHSHSLTLSNKNLSAFNDGKIKLLCENVKLKKKNEELISKINFMSKEFNEIKKDNNDIREELKEKNNTLKNIKLTMDIFNQELIRLQNQMKINNLNNIMNNDEFLFKSNITDIISNNNENKMKNIDVIKNLNIKGIEINSNNEKTPSTGLGYIYDRRPFSNEIKNRNDSQNNQSSSLRDDNNISLAENLNINEEEYKKALNKCQNNKKRRFKNNSQVINNLNLMSQQPKEVYSDFNKEFLKNVDNFSESWRKEVEKMMKRKGNNNY